MKEATKKKVIKALSIGLKVTGVVVGAGVAAAVLGGCPTEAEEKPYSGPVRIREQITLNGKKVYVTATLFPHEMTLVKDKLTAAFGTAAENPTTAGYIGALFDWSSEIELVKNPEYLRYKIDLGLVKTLFNVDHVINALPADLVTTIIAVANATDGGPLQGKITPVHDKGWQKMNGEAVRLANAATKRTVMHGGSYSKTLVYHCA